jgi:hypothetical protein
VYSARCPRLNIEVGGYTDNVCGDEMNQTLSESRAALSERLSGVRRRSGKPRPPAAEAESGTSRVRRCHRQTVNAMTGKLHSSKGQ